MYAVAMYTQEDGDGEAEDVENQEPTDEAKVVSPFFLVYKEQQCVLMRSLAILYFLVYKERHIICLCCISGSSCTNVNRVL
jgi:hypothetical protein